MIKCSLDGDSGSRHRKLILITIRVTDRYLEMMLESAIPVDSRDTAPKCPNLPATHPTGTETLNRIEKSDRPKLKDRKCYNCNQKDHLAKDCPSAFYCYSQIPVSERRRGDQGVVVTGRGVGAGMCGVGLGGREKLGVVVVRKKVTRGEGDNGGVRETRNEEGTGVLGGIGEVVGSVGR